MLIPQSASFSAFAGSKISAQLSTGASGPSRSATALTL